MAEETPWIRQGDIYKIPATPDQRGTNPKTRAFVVYSADADIQSTGEVFAVAVSSNPSRPRQPAFEAELPWQPGGHPKTGFRKQCWAVCHWLRIFQAAELPTRAGFVPARKMTEVIEKIHAAIDAGHPPETHQRTQNEVDDDCSPA